ncbi:methylated-DNA--[protein]-cysteine S-methyltransferase [Mucilaginibacter mali]|uniref:Methylated-DNA--protein-cysteine methyltransferase n=1 Tax=Mucilaginibacter mali TaxID=2740462 RepID=A0A7D4PT29_9SPHI|nr:methylated-DNA--[protein]-cysteine S-methyltransferase [Mucilaginibacter mali]QKJ29588.1 methylated-DNA--[protein]-cysteine S-methyltransferase [Mucilaginibacter mali]
MPVIYHTTPIGLARIEDEDGMICSVTVHEIPVDDATDTSPAINDAAKQLDEYFAGKRKIFDFPFQQKGTDFQQEVWKHLFQISYAETISYATLSKRMNNPLAIRAIASANGRNSMWIVVPCHRVIGSDGSLTGYAGGLWRKQYLLELEARVQGVGQTSLF